MSDDELKSRISAWLSKQGYPLEMRVADSFSKLGFRTIQSEYYTDPQTNTPREIDVYTGLQRDIEGSFIRLAGVVECKADKSKPWLVFSSDTIHLVDAARIVQRAANKVGHLWLRRIARRADIVTLPLFELPKRPGYGITAAFSDRSDLPYAALMSAAGASYAQAARDDSYKEARPFFSVHFPVVVTEAPLFECHLSEAGEVVLTEINTTVIVWRNPVYRLPHCIVHVVRADQIAQFASQMYKDFIMLLEDTDAEMREVLKVMRRARRKARIMGFIEQVGRISVEK